MAKKRQHVYEFEIKIGRSVAESRQQKHSIKARDIYMTSSTYKSHAFSKGIGYAIRIVEVAFRGGIRTMLRIGLILTLHPSKSRARDTYGHLEATE
jgi:hypothetical protein